MSEIERWTWASDGLTQHPLGECVLTVDHLAAVQQLQEQIAAKLEGEIVEGERNRLPANWFEDSSLETWFPLTAEELERTKRERSEAIAERDALRGQVKNLQHLLSVSEDYRRAYADGKYKLYSMGGEICEAAAEHLPMSEGPLERAVRTALPKRNPAHE